MEKSRRRAWRKALSTASPIARVPTRRQLYAAATTRHNHQYSCQSLRAFAVMPNSFDSGEEGPAAVLLPPAPWSPRRDKTRRGRNSGFAISTQRMGRGRAAVGRTQTTHLSASVIPSRRRHLSSTPQPSSCLWRALTRSLAGIIRDRKCTSGCRSSHSK